MKRVILAAALGVFATTPAWGSDAKMTHCIPGMFAMWDVAFDPAKVTGETAKAVLEEWELKGCENPIRQTVRIHDPSSPMGAPVKVVTTAAEGEEINVYGPGDDLEAFSAYVVSPQILAAAYKQNKFDFAKVYPGTPVLIEGEVVEVRSAPDAKSKDVPAKTEVLLQVPAELSSVSILVPASDAGAKALQPGDKVKAHGKIADPHQDYETTADVVIVSESVSGQ